MRPRHLKKIGKQTNFWYPKPDLKIIIVTYLWLRQHYTMKRSPKDLQITFQQKDKANRHVGLVDKLEEQDDTRLIVTHRVR